MISVLCEAGEEAVAQAIAAALNVELPMLSPPQMFQRGAVWTTPPQWDDVLIVVFRTNQAPADLQLPITSYRTAHSAVDPSGNGRSSPGGFVLPVAVDPNATLPPAPIQLIKSIVWDGTSAAIQALRQRIEVLLGLSLMPGRQRVFISYKTGTGTGLATDLLRRLTEAGFAPWLDVEPGNLPAGANVQQIIRDQLQTAAMLILVDTPDVTRSTWIAEELDEALSQFIPVLPVIPGPRNTSHFRAASGYERRALVQRQGPIGGALTEADWQQVYSEIEALLLSCYKRRMRILTNAEREFLANGYSWQVLDQQKRMYQASQPRVNLPPLIVLSHCLVQEPTDVVTLQKYEQYLLGRPRGSETPICLYDRDTILSDREIQDLLNQLSRYPYIIAHYNQLPVLIGNNFKSLTLT